MHVYIYIYICPYLLSSAKKKKIEAVADRKINRPKQNGIQEGY